MNACNPFLCRCLKVPQGMVTEAIAQRALRTIDEVTEATEAGGACMCCHRKIAQLLDEHWAKVAWAERDERVPALLCAAPVDIK